MRSIEVDGLFVFLNVYVLVVGSIQLDRRDGLQGKLMGTGWRLSRASSLVFSLKISFELIQLNNSIKVFVSQFYDLFSRLVYN